LRCEREATAFVAVLRAVLPAAFRDGAEALRVTRLAAAFGLTRAFFRAAAFFLEDFMARFGAVLALLVRTGVAFRRAFAVPARGEAFFRAMISSFGAGLFVCCCPAKGTGPDA